MNDLLIIFKATVDREGKYLERGYTDFVYMIRGFPGISDDDLQRFLWVLSFQLKGSLYFVERIAMLNDKYDAKKLLDTLNIRYFNDISEIILDWDTIRRTKEPTEEELAIKDDFWYNPNGVNRESTKHQVKLEYDAK